MTDQLGGSFLDLFKPGAIDVIQLLWDLHKSPVVKETRKLIESQYDDTISWVDPKGYKLSDRVWTQGQDYQKLITDRVRQGIIDGEDVLDIAEDLESRLLPELQPLRTTSGKIVNDGRKGVLTKTPRGPRGSYSARRLARTEMARAYGNLTEDTARALGLFLEWALSNRHPKEDVCDKNAQGSSPPVQQPTGPDLVLPAGVYDADDFPQYPAHPHCLCSKLTYDARTDEDIVLFLRNKYNLPADPTAPIAPPAPPYNPAYATGKYKQPTHKSLKADLDAGKLTPDEHAAWTAKLHGWYKKPKAAKPKPKPLAPPPAAEPIKLPPKPTPKPLAAKPPPKPPVKAPAAPVAPKPAKATPKPKAPAAKPTTPPIASSGTPQAKAIQDAIDAGQPNLTIEDFFDGGATTLSNSLAGQVADHSYNLQIAHSHIIKHNVKIPTTTIDPMQPIKPTQGFLHTDAVAHYVKNPTSKLDVTQGGALAEGSLGDIPRVVKWKGELYALDGHHRIAAAKVRGDTDLTVKYADLDNLADAIDTTPSWDPGWMQSIDEYQAVIDKQPSFGKAPVKAPAAPVAPKAAKPTPKPPATPATPTAAPVAPKPKAAPKPATPTKAAVKAKWINQSDKLIDDLATGAIDLPTFEAGMKLLGKMPGGKATDLTKYPNMSSVAFDYNAKKLTMAEAKQAQKIITAKAKAAPPPAPKPKPKTAAQWDKQHDAILDDYAAGHLDDAGKDAAIKALGPKPGTAAAKAPAAAKPIAVPKPTTYDEWDKALTKYSDALNAGTLTDAEYNDLVIKLGPPPTPPAAAITPPPPIPSVSPPASGTPQAIKTGWNHNQATAPSHPSTKPVNVTKSEAAAKTWAKDSNVTEILYAPGGYNATDAIYSKGLDFTQLPNGTSWKGAGLETSLKPSNGPNEFALTVRTKNPLKGTEAEIDKAIGTWGIPTTDAVGIRAEALARGYDSIIVTAGGQNQAVYVLRHDTYALLPKGTVPGATKAPSPTYTPYQPSAPVPNDWQAGSPNWKPVKTTERHPDDDSVNAEYNIAGKRYEAAHAANVEGAKEWSSYKGSGYRSMNRQLRDGKVPAFTKPMDKWFGNYVLQKNANLFRGVSFDQYTGLPADWDMRPGGVITEPGYLSTGYGLSTPQGFGGKASQGTDINVLFYLDTPAGATYVPADGDSTNWRGETELIFPRGTRIVIDTLTKKTNSSGGEFYEVFARLEPPKAKRKRKATP